MSEEDTNKNIGVGKNLLKDETYNFPEDNGIWYFPYKPMVGITEEQYKEYMELKERVKQLEKELEPIHKLGIPVETLLAEWERLEDLEDDTDCLKHRIKELEKENESKEKAYNECYCEYKYYRQFASIPKSMIEEKINKLEDSLWEKGYEDEKSYAIKVLKKILEDSNGI